LSTNDWSSGIVSSTKPFGICTFPLTLQLRSGYLRGTGPVIHLKVAGVPLVVGSDTHPGTGALAEIDFLRDSEVFSNLELLKMWSETTPKAIFPSRKLEALEDCYEANFLVLEGNPIQDFSMAKRIRLRVKQGNPLK